MSVRFFKIRSETPGLFLEAAAVVPEKDCEIRAALQISHGMCEHKERYLDFMENMAKKGVVCVIHDHRGHGKSVKSEEDLGYMYGGSAHLLARELHLVTEYIRKNWPGIPIWMLGHSMGSMAARVYLKKYDRELVGMILSGSPSYNELAGVGMVLARVQAFVSPKGRRTRSHLLERLSFGPFAARFRKEKSRFAWCCSSQEVQREYEEDPLCGFTFTADGFWMLGDLMKETYGRNGWEVKNPGLPILFVSGADDPCYRSRRRFRQAVEHLKAMGYENVYARLYPGMRHEILFEKERRKVWRDVERWLKV